MTKFTTKVNQYDSHVTISWTQIRYTSVLLCPLFLYLSFLITALAIVESIQEHVHPSFLGFNTTGFVAGLEEILTFVGSRHLLMFP